MGVPAARSSGGACDCLLVFGGHDLGVAERAADLCHCGIAPLIVVSGGSRAVKPWRKEVLKAAEIRY